MAAAACATAAATPEDELLNACSNDRFPELEKTEVVTGTGAEIDVTPVSETVCPKEL